MLKANISDIPEERTDSPNGRFCTVDRDLNAQSFWEISHNKIAADSGTLIHTYSYIN